VAKNLTLKALRDTRVSPKLSDPELLDAVASTVEKSSARLEQRRRALADCIDKLSSDVRRVVDLYFGRLLPIAEVARQTGRSAGGVKVSLFRVRQWLAACTQKVLGAETS
jgi:RNA polymerase sigma factor (sigma-70 family)